MSVQHPHEVRVLVVEDNPLLRAGLVRALETEIHGAVVGAATTLAEARRLAKDLSPDVVLLDHMLPDGDGAGAVSGIVDLAPDVAVVMVTANNSHAVLRTAVEGGAAGFVLKSAGSAGIFDALWAAERGDAAIGRELLGELLTRAAARAETGAGRGGRGGPRPARDPVARSTASPARRRSWTSRSRTWHRRVRAVATALGGRSTLEA